MPLGHYVCTRQAYRVASYDDLDDTDQVVVRAAWETRDTQLIAALDFTVTCPDCGLAYGVASPPHCGGHTPRT